MTLLAAEKLEHFAEIVRGIRPPDHRNPHRFHEDKSHAVAEMLAEARRLRSMATPRRELPVRPVGEIATGTRTIGRREVRGRFERAAGVTTIVFRDGVLAADTRRTSLDGSISLPGEATKIIRLSSGGLALGAVGRTSFLNRFLAWGADGCKGAAPSPEEDCAYGIVIETLQTLRVYGRTSPNGVAWETAPFQAFGSGAIAAMGALWAGADAEKAIESACRVDVASGMPARIIDLR